MPIPIPPVSKTFEIPPVSKTFLIPPVSKTFEDVTAALHCLLYSRPTCSPARLPAWPLCCEPSIAPCHPLALGRSVCRRAKAAAPVEAPADARDPPTAAPTIDFGSLLDRLKARHVKQQQQAQSAKQQQPRPSAAPDAGEVPPLMLDADLGTAPIIPDTKGGGEPDAPPRMPSAEAPGDAAEPPGGAGLDPAAARATPVSPFALTATAAGSTPPAPAGPRSEAAGDPIDDDLEIVEDGKTPGGKAVAVSIEGRASETTLLSVRSHC